MKNDLNKVLLLPKKRYYLSFTFLSMNKGENVVRNLVFYSELLVGAISILNLVSFLLLLPNGTWGDMFINLFGSITLRVIPQLLHKTQRLIHVKEKLRTIEMSA